MTSSSISSQEAAKRNQIAQKHQIAQEIAVLEDNVRHIRWVVNVLISEEKRLLRSLEGLRGRGGA